MKIGIGSAQFGLNYGLTNSFGKVTKNEIGSILRKAASENISLIDTAASYGDSEEILGKFDLKSFELITKYAPQNLTELKTSNFIKNIESSSAKMGKGIKGFLIHNPSFLIKSPEMIDRLEITFQELRNEISNLKLGISIQNPDQLLFFLDRLDLDIIQGPLNILDQRLYRSGLIEKLNELNIEFHARSIFLQGLLLQDFNQYKKYFLRWSSHLKRIQEIKIENSLNMLEQCLKFVLSVQGVSKIIVGVASLKQFIDILQAYKSSEIINQDLANLFIDEEDLIDPTKWKII